MKTAVTYLYRSSKDTMKEREEKKEWRKTYDPTYTPRRSMLANKFENRRSRVMSVFGRPPKASTYDFSARDSLSSFSTASDRGSMIRDLDRDSMEKAGRNTMLKIPEHVYIPKA